MNRIKALCWTVLLLGPVLAGCDKESPASFEEKDARPRVAMDLSPLFLKQTGGEAVACASVADEVVLTVSQGGGEQTLRAKADTSFVSFEVVVEEGQVDFHAEVQSNNGTLLYAGDTRKVIDDARDFPVQLVLEKQGPVLRVCPRALTLDYDRAAKGYRGAFQIENVGTGTLAWTTRPPEDLCGDLRCLAFADSTGEAQEGAPVALRIAGLRQSENRVFGVHMDSPVGSVALTVSSSSTPPAAGDDRAVVNENQAAAIDLLANDSDLEQDVLAVAEVTPPQFGSVSPPDGGVVLYTAAYEPDPGSTDADRFTYTVTDGAQTSTAAVDVRVNPCIDFDALPNPSIYSPSNTAPGETIFTENSLPVQMHELRLGAFGQLFGSVTVQDRLTNDPSDLVAEIRNAVLVFDFAGRSIRYVSFDFLDAAAALNFSVDDDTSYVATDLSEKLPLPPGLSVRLEDGKFGAQSRLVLTAQPDVRLEDLYDQLLVGGGSPTSQNNVFYIDDVCFGEEAPSTK